MDLKIWLKGHPSINILALCREAGFDNPLSAAQLVHRWLKGQIGISKSTKTRLESALKNYGYTLKTGTK